MQMRTTRNAGTLTITKRWYVNETETDVGDVDVAIVDLAGNEIQASVLAGQVGSVYSYNLTSVAIVNYYIVTWTPQDSQYATFIDEIDVVGHRLFTLGEARAFQDGLVADTTTYPVADLDKARTDIEDLFEKICRVSFIPRYSRQTLDGDGRKSLFLNRPKVSAITAVTEDAVALVIADDVIFYSDGTISKPSSGTWSSGDRQNIVVDYEHGFSSPPSAIARAGKTLLLSLLAGSDVLDRAIVHTDETGTYRLSVPDDKKRPTGIPEVDSVLAQYRRSWGVV